MGQEAARKRHGLGENGCGGRGWQASITPPPWGRTTNPALADRLERVGQRRGRRRLWRNRGQLGRWDGRFNIWSRLLAFKRLREADPNLIPLRLFRVHIQANDVRSSK